VKRKGVIVTQTQAPQPTLFRDLVCVVQGFSLAPLPEICEIKFQLQSKNAAKLAAVVAFCFSNFAFPISIFYCLFRFVVFDLLKVAATRGRRSVPAS
jgi:hypothetical protein